MKSKSSQLLLLLPSDWIEELDLLAESRFISRLQLIRSYLRHKMDEDLSQHAEHLREREKILSAKNKLNRFLQDRS